MQKKKKHQKHNSNILPEKYQHFAALAVIFLSLIIFFNEIVFQGKIFVAADNIASKSFNTLVSDATKEGIFPLWNPYIFCGMPGYASLSVHGERYFDVSAFIANRTSLIFGYILNNPEIGWELFYYFLLGIGIYFFTFDKLKNKIGALIASLGVMHSTYIAVLIMVGHMTKVPVIAFFPFIFLLLEKLRERFVLWQSLILILLIHFMLQPSHMQMIFYVYFAYAIYYIFFLVRTILKKENWLGVIRSGAILAVATGLAVIMTGDQYFSTIEYSKYSMRGSDPIVPSAQAIQKGEDKPKNGGLDYGYATNWSFSPGEMLTFFIPSAYGFGSYSYQGILTQNKPVRLNTYFGPQFQPVDAPQYMGVVILVLAGIGFWKNRKDPFVQYVSITILASVLISFGKEFSLFYDLMFYYVPMFNKFRIPVMILILAQMLIPILAGYGVKSLIENPDALKNENKKQIWQYTLLGLGILLILSVVMKDTLIKIYQFFISQSEAMQTLGSMYGNNQNVLNELYNVVIGMVTNEITFGLLFVLIVFGAFYLYLNKNLNSNLLVSVLVVVILIDLWRVNYKPMETHPSTKSEDLFVTPDFVHFIKQDTLEYRTLEFNNGQPPYDNTLAYWRIQSAYGYQGAKMRQIQDMFDVAGIGNPLLWGLMNVKYILSDRPDSNQILLPVFKGEKYVLYNRAELPRAFYVNHFEVTKGLDILQRIKEMSFNPKEVAFFMEDPKIKIDVPQQGAEAAYTHYGIQNLSLSVKATGNNLLFLSESWYPEGWKAYIDGNETPIYRINYMFRGVVVPIGQHSLTMEFEPRGYYLGKNLSLWMNVLVLAGLGYFGFMGYSKNRTSSL